MTRSLRLSSIRTSFLNLGLHHSRDRNAGPLRDDLGDVFVGHLFAEKRALFCIS